MINQQVCFGWPRQLAAAHLPYLVSTWTLDCSKTAILRPVLASSEPLQVLGAVASYVRLTL